MLRKELRIFLIVGLTSVAIDFAFYRGLLFLTAAYEFSKALGFVAGAVFAYFVNKAWTFGHVEARRGSYVRFGLLYLVGLAANVGSNHLVLFLLAGNEARIVAAFLFATAVSATLNFLGMKFFVFTRSTEAQVVS